MKNIGIMGAGRLGARHLQGVAQIEGAHIWVIDPNENALSGAKNLLHEIKVTARNILYQLSARDIPEIAFQGLIYIFIESDKGF